MGGSTPDEELLESLRAAVEASPDGIPLRLHLAELLAAAGNREESVRHAAITPQQGPTNQRALTIIGAAPAPEDRPQPRAADACIDARLRQNASLCE